MSYAGVIMSGRMSAQSEFAPGLQLLTKICKIKINVKLPKFKLILLFKVSKVQINMHYNFDLTLDTLLEFSS